MTMPLSMPEWRVTPGLTPYSHALAEMQARAAAIRAGTAGELVWLIEHPPLYTSGTSADPAELFNPQGYPVFAAGRGGRYTYHGPGQRVGYVLLDLATRGRDVRAFVDALEGWVIAALARVGVTAHRAPGRIGIWVGMGDAEAKIGAIGVRVSRWVTMHGFAINIDPVLNDFQGIVPCGIREHGVTSVRALGNPATQADLDAALHASLTGFLAALANPQVRA